MKRQNVRLELPRKRLLKTDERSRNGERPCSDRLVPVLRGMLGIGTPGAWCLVY